VITVILPVKDISEVLPITVNFSDMLQFGETINGANCVASLFSGTDSNPGAIIVGAATYTATTITQIITGGLSGNTYTLAFLVTGNNSHNYVKVGQLSVINSSSPY
jgi:hypothetical protein